MSDQDKKTYMIGIILVVLIMIIALITHQEEFMLTSV